MNKFAHTALVLAAFFGIHAQSSAAVIDFNTNQDGTYWVQTVTSNGFVATENIHENGSPLGTNRAVDGAGPSNGTVHLDSWTNGGANSIWTLTKQGGDLFSLQGFDFANGYYWDSYSVVSSVTLTGTKADQSTVSQIFAISTGQFQTLSVSPAFTDLVSVRFDAFGSGNRAAYDNIIVNQPSDVPEPATLGLLGLGLAGFAAARRKPAK